MMTYVDDYKKTFDAADFCEILKGGVGEGRITSNTALRDNAAVAAAVKCLQTFANLAAAPVGPDVVAAYVTYSPGAPEVFTALRAISVNTELVSSALECLTCIVKYSLNGSKPQQPLEQARSIVKEIVKSRAVLIYNILATDGRACAKKALNLLRLVATCHPMLAKELVNRFDLSAMSMARSLCSVRNNHCRVPFLDLMFVILASGERDVLHYIAGKGREVIVTCLRTIRDRAILEASAGVGGSTKSILWKQGTAHHKKRPNIQPSHVQKRELVAAINFLLALEKHLFVGMNKSNRGALAHPIPTILASLATTEIPPIEIAPREVRQEHEFLRTTATRLFILIAKNPLVSTPVGILKPLNNASFNFGTETVVKFVSTVVQEKPGLATHLLTAGRILSAPPALTLRWFGYFSVIASCVVHLSSPITTFKEKHFFEKCFSHSDLLIRHLGSVLAISFCKVLERSLSAEQRADDYLPALEVIQRMVKPGSRDDDVIHRFIASYQSLVQKHVAGTDVKLMMTSVDAAGEDAMAAARTIEAALRTTPYSAIRKVVHKHYLSRLITNASQTPQAHVAVKLWRVCKLALRCTDLFQPGTGTEIDVYLSVLSSLGEDVEEPAKAFEAMIAQALEMPYGLYDRLHSEEWSEESATIRTSQLAVATTIKLQRLAQIRSTREGCESSHLFEKTLRRMVLSVVAVSSLLREQNPNSYLSTVLPSVLNPTEIWWEREGIDEVDADVAEGPQGIATRLVLDRGTFPKTKCLRLIEGLVAFDKSIDTTTRKHLTPKARVELGLAWDSWCTYWLSTDSDSEHRSHANISKKEKRSKERSDFLFQGVTRFLLDAYRVEKMNVETNDGLNSLRESLAPDDYRFATAMMLKTVENVKLLDKLLETSLLQLSDMLSHQAVQPEESEFLYESLLLALSERSRWNASQVNKMLSFCVSVMSNWDRIGGWEVHVAYSIALMKTLLSHFSTRVAALSRVFLSTRIIDSLPPLTKLTHQTINNLYTVLEHSPAFRRIAVAQVYGWSEKQHRSASGALLQLLSTALNLTVANNQGLSKEKLLERFVKNSLRSKSEWISNALTKDDRYKFRALSSISKAIVQARKPLVLLLQCFFRADSFSRNSWTLLGTILESRKLGAEPEITDEELTKLLSLIIKYIGSFSGFEDACPDIACLKVLECVTRRLRLRKLSFYGLAASMDQDVASLSKSLTDCAQSRFSFLFSDSEMFVDDLSSRNLTDSNYIASVLACQAEIFKLDLSLESPAKEALVKLGLNDGRFFRYCLTDGANTSLHDDFPRANNMVIQLMSMVKAAVPWLSHAICYHDLAKSLLCMQRIMSTQLNEIAFARNERHASVRECMKMISNYIKANDLEKRFPSIVERMLSTGIEATTALNAFPKPLLEEAANHILESSYHTVAMKNLSDTRVAKKIDPVFVLNMFLQGCQQALLQLRAPVLDLHRIARDGLFALALTGTASTNQELHALSFACLEAFATVVGPTTAVPPGSASGLYKDRRQLAFLLELLRNSISDPMTQVLPLFAVWFRTACCIVLSPDHAANKIVTTLLLRAPCLDVSDCYGLSHFLNCDASGAELQAIKLLAFDVIQKGVHSQRDVSVVRRRKIFDNALMFAASAMGSNSSVRTGALKSFEVMINRTESLDVTDELISGHGILAWLAGDAKHIGETAEEVLIKLKIMRSIAADFDRRGIQAYGSVLAEALTLFAASRVKSTMTEKDLKVTEGVVECAASIARVSPRKRFLFRIDFAALWTQFMSKKVATFKANQDFVRCVCRQRETVARPDILEMLLAHTIHENESQNRVTSDIESWSDELSMIHMFVAECLLDLKHKANSVDLVTSELCNLLAMSLYVKSTVWLVVAAIATLDICGSLTDPVVACTDKIPAFPPQELKPHFEQQFCSVVDEIRLIIADALLALGDRLSVGPSGKATFDGMIADYHTPNGIPLT